jgi:hypothetical protein
MKDLDRYVHQMTIRVLGLMAQCIDEFAAGGAARQLYAELQAGIIDFEHKTAAHGTGLSEARRGTQLRSETREALRALLELIRSAARVMGVEEHFPPLPVNNDDELLQMADVYAAHALPLKAQFIAHELPPDFLEDLAADKAAFQAAIAGQANAVGDHVSAREDTDNARDNLLANVRKLDGVYKVKYANNPGKLAEWTAASHVERPRRKPKAAEPPPPPKTSDE